MERKATCPRPDCETEITQTKLGDSGWWIPMICSDCSERNQMEVRRRQQVDRASRIERAIEAAGLPRKQFRELPSADWTGELGRALSICERFISREIPERWLLLEGQCGAGKTMLACELSRRYIEMHGGERSVRFTTTADLILAIKATYSGNGDEFELISRWQNCALLVLDDFGVESVTAHTLEKLSMILDARYRREALTIFTSNLTFEKLAAHLAIEDPLAASRIADRLDELSKWIRIAGKSRRTKAADRAKLRAVKSFDPFQHS